MTIKPFGIVLPFIALAAHAADFRVADPKEHGDFPSVTEARDAIRAWRKRGHANEPATITLADGGHAVTAVLEFTTEDKLISIRADHVGRALLDAALKINANEFEISKDARIPAESQGKVLQVDLAKYGVKHRKAFPDRFNDGGGLAQLFVNETWQTLSRWPNDHKATMKRVLDRGDDPGKPVNRQGSFVYEEDRPARWKAAADAGQLWLAGFWRVAWDWQNVRVKSIDTANKSITLAAPVGGGIGSKYAGPEGAGTEPWIAVNLVEEIDQPGEWAVDFNSGTLFWWPPCDLKGANITLADFDGPIIRMKGATHITINGVVLQGALGNGIEITGGDSCAVIGCELRCIGRNGVVIKNGMHHQVASCDLHELGHGGILLGGGNRETLSACGHIADNNHIHHYAKAKKIWSPGIGIGANDAGYACGCVVTHNLIHDSPHAAVLYGGNDHRIEFNEVHDFLIESDDLGGFYTNNGWTSYGNVLRHNFIHHTSHALGIYLDDGDSGDTLEENIMYRLGTGAAIGGGHDNIMRNNIAIECPGGFGIDARGVSRKYDQDSGMLSDYLKLKPDHAPWSERFPTLPKLLENTPGLPTGCVIERNVVIGSENAANLRGKNEHFKVVTVRDNFVIQPNDLDFANAAKMDFRIAPSAPVFKKVPGFQAIPFEKIGLYLDEHRKSLPAHPSGYTKSEWHGGN